MTPKPKTAVGVSPSVPVRLIVKKEVIRTVTPVTYDGKRLNDAMESVINQFGCLMALGVIATVIGLSIGNLWTFGVSIAAFLYGAYGFFYCLNVWESDMQDEESVEEQLYVELPPGFRINE